MSLGMTVEVKELVEKAKEGHVGAMKTLYDINRERILKLAFGYTRNMEDAEEILQDTFVKAFVALKKNKLRENGNFPAWVYRIGINTSLDLVKKNKKHRHEKDKAAELIRHERSSVKTPEEEVLQSEITGKLNQSLEFLSPQQRLIFTMKHFQQLKIREIADYLACSEGNVKQQLFRAVRRLKNKLSPYIPEAGNDM
jgi:RNA polymerase sigma-70 factor (ECF subfamily)